MPLRTLGALRSGPPRATALAHHQAGPAAVGPQTYTELLFRKSSAFPHIRNQGQDKQQVGSRCCPPAQRDNSI